MQFFFRRLLKLVLHQAIERLDFVESSVESGKGQEYHGLALANPIVCAVTLMRGGMHLAHSALTESVSIKSLSIGHILIGSGAFGTEKPAALYAKFPLGLKGKRVLLVDFCIGTGNDLIAAINALLMHHATQSTIVVVAPIASEEGLFQIRREFPELAIHTAVVHKVWTDDFDIKRLES
jgi:uracil phosphoribosyltransferase